MHQRPGVACFILMISEGRPPVSTEFLVHGDPCSAVGLQLLPWAVGRPAALPHFITKAAALRAAYALAGKGGAPQPSLSGPPGGGRSGVPKRQCPHAKPGGEGTMVAIPSWSMSTRSGSRSSGRISAQ